MPPAYVKPSVKRQKTDATDAEATVRRSPRPTFVFVETKTRLAQAAANAAAAFRFLRRASSPKAPRPPAKGGRAAGSGVSETAVFTKSY